MIGATEILPRSSFTPLLRLAYSRQEIYVSLCCFILYLRVVGLLGLAITWYKIRHAGGQTRYYSRTETSKQRDLNQ